METTPEQVEAARQYQLAKYGYDVYKYYHLKSRLKLFVILGDVKCVNCGHDDLRALQFDHIKAIGKMTGYGNKDRERFNGIRDRTAGTLKYSRSDFMKYYVEHVEEARQELQVLCANCHWIKTHYLQQR